jgi:hypothetical protein
MHVSISRASRMSRRLVSAVDLTAIKRWSNIERGACSTRERVTVRSSTFDGKLIWSNCGAAGRPFSACGSNSTYLA